MIRSDNDTIAAIATPPGNAGIGIIRISGNRSIKIADEIIRSRYGKSLDLFSAETHSVHYAYIFDGSSFIDEVFCTVFKAPRSYTAEDVVEISCHGGMYILNSVLSLILSRGARLAEPGEFTKRAFINGRIDLSQAESVMDLISSENEFSRSNSLSQLRGSVKVEIINIREKILYETAFIEAVLDDPEHFSIDADHKRSLYDDLTAIKNRIDKILADSEDLRFLNNGINLVIAGKPNVGKSSLLNIFSGYERAIVTDIPGTTRDTISERIKIDDLMINVTDTAGIHTTDDEVENIGINRAKEQIRNADLVLFMIDSSEEIDDTDIRIAELIDEKKCILVLNKTDKGIDIGSQKIFNIINAPVIRTSIPNDTGIDDIKDRIREMFIKKEIQDDHVYITNKRQAELLRYASLSLSLVIDSIEKNMPEDLYTIDLMDAYTYLGNIIGEDISDDLADKIFSEFCMGK